jgi:hypothetical protein
MNTMDKPPDIDQELNQDDLFCPSLKKQQILNDGLPPLDIVRQMIKYETSLRLSDPVQQLFDLYHTDDNAITLVYFLVIIKTIYLIA